MIREEDESWNIERENIKERWMESRLDQQREKTDVPEKQDHTGKIRYFFV